MIYEREEQLKEQRAVIERMETDYHIIFKENADLRRVKGVVTAGAREPGEEDGRAAAEATERREPTEGAGGDSGREQER